MVGRPQTPLPTAQIAVLMGVRLAEPISYTVIFPFINQMVEELGVTDNPDRIGFYSGLIESVFAFVQFFTVYHWAKLSDKIGRKPVIFIGLLGVIISGSLFGLSTSFWMMIFIRCLSGALNGNVAVIKAAIGDITDDSNSTDAFALYGLTWTVGSIIGNALGGTLSHPAERIPSLFGQSRLLIDFPFLLPCLVTAGLTLIGIGFCHFFYTESLPDRAYPLQTLHRRSESTLSDTTLVEDTEALLGKQSRRQAWGFRQLMAYKPVRILSLTVFSNSFIGGAWAAGYLLFLFDRNNGLGMSPWAIGIASALNGLWTICAQLLLLTRIRKYLGLSRAYKVLSFGWIPVWLLLPRLRDLMEMTETPVDGMYPPVRGWATSIGVNLMLSFVTVVGLSNSLMMVIINLSSPDRMALGAVNGIATAAGCMARVLGPSLVSALFAISMDGKVLGGDLWWIFMAAMSVVNFSASLLVSADPVQTWDDVTHA